MPALLGASASDAKRSAEVYAALGPGGRAVRGAGRRGAARVPRRARHGSCGPTRSSPRSRRSPTRRSSATTSTAGRSSLYLRDTGDGRATRPRHRGRADPPAPPDDLRAARSSLTSSVGEVRSFFGEGKGSQQELDLEHLSSIVEVLNERFGTDLDRRRQAAVRPVRGDLGRRRRAVRPGPEQQHRELPARLRPQVPADDRHAHGRQRARSSSGSSTTTSSASCSATTTSRRSTSSYAKRRDGRGLRPSGSSDRESSATQAALRDLQLKSPDTASPSAGDGGIATGRAGSTESPCCVMYGLLRTRSSLLLRGSARVLTARPVVAGDLGLVLTWPKDARSPHYVRGSVRPPVGSEMSRRYGLSRSG